MNKMHVYLPETRVQEEMVEKQTEAMKKVEYLQNHESVKNITIMPDFADDDFGVSGAVFQSKGVVFPTGVGTDPGCGYMVLHVPSEQVVQENIKETFQDLCDLLVKQESSVTFTEKDFEELTVNPYQWAKKRGFLQQEIEGTTETYETESKIPFPLIQDTFGRLAKGNHFIEMRVVEDIMDEASAASLGIKQGDYLFHIHNGSGTQMKEVFLEYLVIMGEELKNLPEHGYEVYMDLERYTARQFIEDAKRSIQFSVANRIVIWHHLQNWIGAPLRLILDDTHDTLSKDGDVITYQKAVQRYHELENKEISILPSSMNEITYLIQKGNFPYVQHGSGDGKKGKALTTLNPDMTTNLKEVPNRMFYSFEEGYRYGLERNWYTPVLTLQPKFLIKNRNNW